MADLLRRFGRRRAQTSDVLEADRLSTDADDSLTQDYVGALPEGRRSSEPPRTLSAPNVSRPSSGGGRNARHTSIPEENLLSSSIQSTKHGKRDISPSSDDLGLTLIHACPEPLVDLIFVHGLGGTSRKTWSWQRDPDRFWPAWLGEDAELCKSRIFTFGYNADFSGQHTPLNILDFAKDLLFRMKTHSSAQILSHQSVGKYPIIFVMHSMGGLVVKKAYVIGRSDEQYASIVSQIQGMLFLATPHRGSASADILNNILRTTPGLSAKLYISELGRSSNSLQDINEQFRTTCTNIKLVSLYETQKTNMGLGVNKYVDTPPVIDSVTLTLFKVVEKESAVLGYPKEDSSPLNADHHGMSKFRDTEDANYVHVRGILRMFLEAIKAPVLLETFTDSARGRISSIAAKEELEELLGISEDPADDLEIIRDRIMPGSCQWILRRQSFLDWVNVRSHDSRILWLTGLPAVGKSVLSSFIIDHLQKDSSIQNCYYYFFKCEDQSKRTVGQMLRSLAFQIAKSIPSFGAKLAELYHTGALSSGQQKVNTIWETIFEGVLFRQNFSEPLFWVIDGLDEADQPETLTRLLSRLQSKNRFRILIVSRMIRDLTSSFGTNIVMAHEEISIDDTFDDIRSYTSSVISATLRTDKGQDDLCNKVLDKAHGSFLWVALALEQLKDNWHTQNDVDQVLNDLPEGMEPLYMRMMEIISEQAPRPRTIASRILTWTVCAFRPLEIAELEVVLAPEFGEFLSLKDTVTQICGNFVVVEKSRVALIHDTARHFLLYNTDSLPMTIDRRLGNNHIAAACMKFLMNPKKNWRRTLSLGQMKTSSFSPTQMKGPLLATQLQGRHTALFDAHPFLSYAATWWAYHISLASPNPDLSALVFDFLEQSCLVWIHALALLGDMRTLTRAAQYLKIYIKRKNRKSSNDSLISLSGNRDDELRQWAKDFIRVVGRFGSNLIQNPQSIYKHIVPFCPKGSIISRTYGRVGALSVAGISSEVWDDCLARLTIGDDEYAVAVLCKGMYFVTLLGSGTIVVWHAESCGEARRLHHGEWVSVMGCSKVSYLVATAGTKTIRVWNINTGDEEFCLSKTYQRRILALSFGDTDDELRIGYDDSTIHCYDLATSTEKWRILAEENGDWDHTCPHLVSFSPDACQVLIGYRGRPVLAWSLDSPRPRPQKCIRPEDRFGRHGDSSKAGTPEFVLWHPESPVVLILYNDTTLVEWNIEDDVQREIAHIGAREMAISPDGNLLLTSDYNGTLSVWTVPEFRLAYQLRYDDMVRSLAFSPDGQRFYDIRGPLCNVWEPDALVRPDDLDREELSSTQDTAFSEPVSSVSDAGRVQITALICDSDDGFFCCGKDSGAVVLHEMKRGEKIRKLYSHSSVVSITEMAWSKSEKYIASADDCGRVIAKRLRKPAGQTPAWGVYPLLDFRPGEAVLLLLFSSSEDYLLISSSTYDCVWSLEDKKEICRSVRKSDTGYKWINHPHDPSLLVRFHSKEVRFFHWETLEEVHGSGLEECTDGDSTVVELAPPSLSQLSLERTVSDEALESIERVVQMHKTKTILEVFPNTGSNDTAISRRRLTVLDIAPQSLQQHTITELSGRVNRLIGSYQEHLVFLDRQYCFCTWDINGSESPLKRHFFLPKDWLSPGMLRLCILNKHGTILCPKNGEVAIIRFGINL